MGVAVITAWPAGDDQVRDAGVKRQHAIGKALVYQPFGIAAARGLPAKMRFRSGKLRGRLVTSRRQGERLAQRDRRFPGLRPQANQRSIEAIGDVLRQTQAPVAARTRVDVDEDRPTVH